MTDIPEITVDWLLARVVERDGCLIWKGEASNNGKDPRGVLNNQRFYVRRAVWKAMQGREPPADWCYVARCEVPGCVDPAHVTARTRSQALKGIPKSLAHRAKIAATKRAASGLPQEKVQEILASPRSGSQEGALHGISKDMVNKIRAGQIRRDYSGPFSQLGAR